MNVVTRRHLANPAEMIAHGTPRVIHNGEELEAYTESKTHSETGRNLALRFKLTADVFIADR